MKVEVGPDDEFLSLLIWSVVRMNVARTLFRGKEMVWDKIGFLVLIRFHEDLVSCFASWTESRP